MILVLGGTTEGRKAVAELEEAGNISTIPRRRESRKWNFVMALPYKVP